MKKTLIFLFASLLLAYYCHKAPPFLLKTQLKKIGILTAIGITLGESQAYIKALIFLQ